MPTESLHAAKPSLAYAKLVATPTTQSWSQVYNAGNLFASISLATSEAADELALTTIGKSIVNNLEAEFFTLEEKTLQTIKSAIETSIKDMPPHIELSLCLTCFKDDILYLFIVGQGRIVMKRQEKIGVLLEKRQGHTERILTASGYLHNNDIVVLESSQFAANIPDETLTSALELALPNDIAEALSPQLHAKEDGGQAAIIIAYHGKTRQLLEPEEAGEVFDEEEESYEEQRTSDDYVPTTSALKMPTLPPLPRSLPRVNLPQMNGLTHTKKLVLSVIIILVALLLVGLIFTKQQQDGKRQQELFQTIYAPAQKNYDEGMELKSLNQNLSNKDFREAENLLQEGLKKFPKGSNEEKQLTELLSSVEKELGGTEETAVTPAKEASVGADDLLALEKKNSGISFAQDTTNAYVLTKNGVSSIAKSSGKKKELIKADAWKNPLALAPYQGNIYILDAKVGVLKYVASGDSFAKSDYFKEKAPDLSKATAMAIDRSIWILFKDGTIQKYTSGKQDSLTLKGLTKPLLSPTKLVTNAEMSSVYVLDKGNGRIVKFGKDGSFQSEYATAGVNQATDFEVDESAKKLYLLSGGKILEISTH